MRKNRLEQVKNWAAKRFTNPQDLEDFAAYVVMRELEAPTKKLFLTFLQVEFLRKQYGRVRNVKANGDKTGSRYELNNACGLEDWDQAVKPRQEDACLLQESLMSVRNESRIDHAMLWLKHVWGFSNKEIGDCFGYQPVPVCKRVTELEKELRQKGG